MSKPLTLALTVLFSTVVVSTSSCKKSDETKDAPKTAEATKPEAKPNTKPEAKPVTKPVGEPEAKLAQAQPFDATALYDVPVKTLDGKDSTIGAHKGKALLVVNVASKCGLTPQYATLEKLQREYKDKGFTVLGFPCNQFGGQEPGSHEEIATFCTDTYGVTFPMFEKVEVNGESRHPIYQTLTAVKDAKGEAGDIKWNFEKFVVSADGTKIHRFRPKTVPDAAHVIAAIEAGLPKSDATAN